MFYGNKIPALLINVGIHCIPLSLTESVRWENHWLFLYWCPGEAVIGRAGVLRINFVTLFTC